MELVVKYIKENVFSIIAALGSLSAMIMSIRSYNLTKRQVYANVLATNRIKWVNDIRDRLGEFLECYLSEYNKPPDERFNTIRKKFQIDTYMDYSKGNKGYADLNKQLTRCLESPVEAPVTDFKELIETAQKVLGEAYLRAKRESGVTEKMDEKMRNQIRGI